MLEHDPVSVRIHLDRPGELLEGTLMLATFGVFDPPLVECPTRGPAGAAYEAQ